MQMCCSGSDWDAATFAALLIFCFSCAPTSHKTHLMTHVISWIPVTPFHSITKYSHFCDVIKGPGAPASHPARCWSRPLRPPYGRLVLSSSNPANKSTRGKEGELKELGVSVGGCEQRAKYTVLHLGGTCQYWITRVARVRTKDL